MTTGFFVQLSRAAARGARFATRLENVGTDQPDARAGASFRVFQGRRQLLSPVFA